MPDYRIYIWETNASNGQIKKSQLAEKITALAPDLAKAKWLYKHHIRDSHFIAGVVPEKVYQARLKKMNNKK